MDDIVTANPRLELRAAGRTWQATGGRPWTIGRATEADVHLDNPRVSRDHAVLQPTPAGWVLVNHSTNGMFVNGQRVESLTIRQPVTVVLGSVTSGETLQLYPVAQPPRRPRPQPVAPHRTARRDDGRPAAERGTRHRPVGRHDRPRTRKQRRSP